MEKEAQLVVNELWAKLSARERFIAFGSVAVAVGWLLGLILGSSTYGVTGYFSYTVNYFTAGTAGLCVHLALVAAIATVVVLYLKIAPNMNISWPLPVVQILLILPAAAGILGVLALLLQFTDSYANPPIMMYVADALIIAGGGFAAFNAYQEFLASKTA